MTPKSVGRNGNHVLGPCRCQGCHRKVYLYRTGRSFRWGDRWGRRHGCVADQERDHSKALAEIAA